MELMFLELVKIIKYNQAGIIQWKDRRASGALNVIVISIRLMYALDKIDV